jgi:hypothetical protein
LRVYCGLDAGRLFIEPPMVVGVLRVRGEVGARPSFTSELRHSEAQGAHAAHLSASKICIKFARKCLFGSSPVVYSGQRRAQAHRKA